MEQHAIRLYGLEGLALIIEFPSGVHYTNQAGGVFCQQPRTEGVLVPLGSECHLEEKFDMFFAEKPIHLNLDDADALDEILHTPEEPYVETPTFFLEVDRNRLDDSMEAWLYVTITACPDKMGVPPFEWTADERYPVFGFGRSSAVLTWPNSD